MSLGGLAEAVLGAGVVHLATSELGDHPPLSSQLVSPRRIVLPVYLAAAMPTVTVSAYRARLAGPASHAIPARPAPFGAPFNAVAIVAASVLLSR